MASTTAKTDDSVADPVSEAPPRPTPWIAAPHPHVRGFYCLKRERGSDIDYFMDNDNVALYWSRGDATAAGR